MNIELLRKVAAVIQEKPAEFDMEFWHARGNRIWGSLNKEVRACGTTHCIAGWAHLIDGRFPRSATLDAAQKILDISGSGAQRLFYRDDWPEEFDETPEGAAARIEHFIATDGDD